MLWIWEQINLLYSLLAAWNCFKNRSTFSAEVFPSCLFFMGLRHWCDVECNWCLPHLVCRRQFVPSSSSYPLPRWKLFLWSSLVNEQTCKYLWLMTHPFYFGPRFSLWQLWDTSLSWKFRSGQYSCKFKPFLLGEYGFLSASEFFGSGSIGKKKPQTFLQWVQFNDLSAW